MTIDVLVVWPNRPDAMAQLERTYRLHHLHSAPDPEKLLADVAPTIRAIVTTGEKGATRELIERLPALEIISCFGVGVDGINHEACRERGVIVTNTPDVLSKDVADLALGLTLAVQRRMVEADRYVRAGKWQNGPMDLGTRAAGRTMGIIGMGRIGRELAKRASALEMNILYHNRREVPGVPYGYRKTPVALAEDSDVLALCCPGGDATRGLVNAEVLRALGPRGIVINVARGTVIDEPALVKALQDGTIAGAGLDVFENEPNVPAELLTMDNVVLQPHQASATEQTRDAMAQLVVDNLAAHFAGKPLLTRYE